MVLSFGQLDVYNVYRSIKIYSNKCLCLYLTVVEMIGCDV